MIRFNSTEYQYTHGRKPSNEYGVWAFKVNGHTKFLNGTLKECKAEIKRLYDCRSMTTNCEILP